MTAGPPCRAPNGGTARFANLEAGSLTARTHRDAKRPADSAPRRVVSGRSGVACNRPVMDVLGLFGRLAQAKVDPGCCQLPVVSVRCRRLEWRIWTQSAGVEAPGCSLGASRRVCADVLMGLWWRCLGPAGRWAWCWAVAGWAACAR